MKNIPFVFGMEKTRLRAMDRNFTYSEGEATLRVGSNVGKGGLPAKDG